MKMSYRHFRGLRLHLVLFMEWKVLVLSPVLFTVHDDSLSFVMFVQWPSMAPLFWNHTTRHNDNVKTQVPGWRTWDSHTRQEKNDTKTIQKLRFASIDCFFLPVNPLTW